ncbi:MAG: UDP-N-acetylmuramate--alanine ligase [Elusimicrobia bacterium]|nr:UDP-N-acetylmuramate--alanine ligase [Elusimicrobiota bacterium]
MAEPTSIHFVGIGGVGMSSLAQIHVMAGGKATGSDRLFDRGENLDLKEKLQALSMRLHPQDGSGITADTDLVVLSTAIEDSNPEVAAAKKLSKPVIHRSELLARHVERSRTIAVTGTSGKSTVAAMVFEILQAAGRSPSVITGASLISLKERGLYGNAFRGASDLLVIEADESDGSLVNYRPAVGLFLNLTKDHKEVAAMKDILRRFSGNARSLIVNADDPNLAELASKSATFGLRSGELKAERVESRPSCSRFSLRDVEFVLPLPGRYNVENAVAAVAACLGEGVSLADCSRALASYKGLSRRFERVGSAGGVEVIDDYAHNPAKVAAVLSAASLGAARVLAVYQPHGFAPTRLLRSELIGAFAEHLRPQDMLWMPDIYYVGGAASKDVSSADITGPLSAKGIQAFHVPRRDDIIFRIAQAARPGDLVLVMGARDPTLSAFARAVLRAL